MQQAQVLTLWSLLTKATTFSEKKVSAKPLFSPPFSRIFLGFPSPEPDRMRCGADPRTMRVLGIGFFWVVVEGLLLVSGQLQHSLSEPHWHPATATWYGSPDGDGSDGGACGYGSLVDVKPFRARVGAVSPVLFKGGVGCGACYKVKCLDHSICSRRAVTIIVTDECPGGYCSGGRTHFDLSGAAFGRMAVAGNNNQLRDRGEISVVFRRTPCKYPGKNIAFHVNEGSTDYWLSLLVEFEDGDGDVGSMHIREASSTEWLEMRHVWGANWCITRGPLKGPFSVKLTTLSTGRTLSARDVIPRNWAPKATYTSRLNFF